MTHQALVTVAKRLTGHQRSLPKLLAFMTQETTASKHRVLLLAAVAGIANSMLLVIINQAVVRLQNGTAEMQLIVQYLLIFMLFIFTQRMSQREAVAAVEEALQGMRVRIADKVRRSELRTVEALGDISHYSSLTQGANTIAQSAMYLVTGVEALLVLLFASLYLLWLSPPSFLVVSVLLGFAIPFFIRHYQKTAQELADASRKEGLFFERFTALLQGFKQLKVDQRKSDAVFSHLRQLALETSALKSRANVRLLEDILLSNVLFYLLLLLVVFILPPLFSGHQENLFPVVATVLFMMEPISTISSSLPSVSKTNVAISGLYRLDERLDKALAEEDQGKTGEISTDFTTLALSDCSFTYKNIQDQPLFTVGPCSVTCRRGELLFITGSNGSGKSTFLKLLTGLYRSEQGFIQLDRQRLENQDYFHYRQLFSVVFSDFHLFDQLYGLQASDAEVNAWLEELDISHKTHCENGRFTNTALSTGHRKRLAFIVAVLQQRPVLVLDELAADQDAAFRQRLYHDLLPKLKHQGKIIILVTHDEQYFRVADRVLRMEAGKLEEQTAR